MSANLLSIQDSTIVTGVTSEALWLAIDINDKSVGIPLYTFSSSTPSLDFVDLLTLDFEVNNATTYSQATSYGAGIALSVNGENAAWPLFKVEQEDIQDTVVVSTPTIVSNISAQAQYVAVQVNNQAYGVPLYDYTTVFPFTSTVAMSSIGVTTIMNKPTKNVGLDYTPSTNLNNKIKTYSALINRTKTQLGYPFVNLEVCDDAQLVDFIDLSIEFYTKYAGWTEEYLIFDSQLYEEPGLRLDSIFSITPTLRSTESNGASGGWDYDLADYRKVAGVFSFEPGETTGINTLFTLEQAMSQQTYFSYQLGNAGFDLVTWEVLKQWLDLRTKVLAQTHYVDFNEDTQRLRLIPAPLPRTQFYGVVGAWVEKPICHLLKEQWIQKYTLALTKIAIGNVRGKYQGMQMFGGGTINYSDLLNQGLKEKDELEKGIQNGTWYDTPPARFFIG